ncbi:MAG: pyridine nucleotide-disulfide oxidoreductase [Anaerolineales bacterium]|nr:MAG: pyridine nucleotide-disulfide oxidoreductase [Anaerolineales bacterium]
MYDLIILGGGPAGLTATVYALRKRLDVLLITRDLGGKTNYRLQLPFVEKHLVITGEEVVSRFANEIDYLEFARVFDKTEKVEKTENGFKLSTRDGNSYEAKSIIVATGALGRLLKVPGEKEYMMRGLCYSAVSYAPLFIERDVVVIGDTKLALRSTAELARIARKVTLVAPSHGELDTAMGANVLKAKNVEVMEGYRVDEVLGDEYARTIVVSQNGKKTELTADAFFVELELEPQSSIVADIVELDDHDRIKIDARNRTSTQGLFAAGDVTDVIAEQVLIAVGEGAKAALAAYEYILETA